MDYQTASKMFNIETRLNELEKLNSIEIMDRAEKMVRIAEEIQISSKNKYKFDIENMQYKYISTLKGLIFFIANGIKPGGVNDANFQLFKPIIENLIEQGEIKEEILKLF